MPSATKIRQNFSEVVDEAHHGACIPITRNNRKVAALVPYELVQYVEELEDLIDGAQALEIKERIRQGKEKVYHVEGDVRDWINKL